VSEKVIMNPKTRVELLGSIPGQYKQYHYKGTKEGLYEEYRKMMTDAGKTAIKDTAFYTKIFGLVVEEGYRDGVCGKCRDGAALERKKKDLGGVLRDPNDVTNYKLVQEHKVTKFVLFVI
jgi:hypothetical protein